MEGLYGRRVRCGDGRPEDIQRHANDQINVELNAQASPMSGATGDLSHSGISFFTSVFTNSAQRT
jgi:hypothetical protein